MQVTSQAKQGADFQALLDAERRTAEVSAIQTNLKNA